MVGARWSEDRLHAALARTLSGRSLRAGFGHDAAALRRGLRRPVLCCDQTVEGVHYGPDVRPARAGAKAAARALSDLAAAAAEPRALLLSLCLPPERAEPWALAFLRAVARAAERAGAELVGGDLACAPGPVVASVTAVGEGPAMGGTPSRAGARPGMALLATGPCGGSALGRHLRIRPRLAEGRWLWARGARALMDTTDGLLRDLGRLARASGVRLELDEVPLHRDARRAARLDGRAALTHAYEDGEDHELLTCVPKARVERLLREAPRRCPGLVRLGTVRSGRGVVGPRPDGSRGELDVSGGWCHGAD